jgi:hypothetical protein
MVSLEPLPRETVDETVDEKCTADGHEVEAAESNLWKLQQHTQLKAVLDKSGFADWKTYVKEVSLIVGAFLISAYSSSSDSLTETFSYFDFCTVNNESGLVIPLADCLTCKGDNRIVVPAYDNTSLESWGFSVVLATMSVLLFYYVIMLLEKRDRSLLFLTYGVYTSHLKRNNFCVSVLFYLVVFCTGLFAVLANLSRNDNVPRFLNPEAMSSTSNAVLALDDVYYTPCYLNHTGTFELLFAGFYDDNPSDPAVLLGVDTQSLVSILWAFISTILIYVALVPHYYRLVHESYQLLNLSESFKLQAAPGLVAVQWKVSDTDINMEVYKFVREKGWWARWKIIKRIYWSNGLLNACSTQKKEKNFAEVLQRLHTKGKFSPIHEPWEQTYWGWQRARCLIMCAFFRVRCCCQGDLDEDIINEIERSCSRKHMKPSQKESLCNVKTATAEQAKESKEQAKKSEDDQASDHTFL